MPGRTENREGGHVRSEQRKQKHEAAQRSSRQKILFRFLAMSGGPIGEYSDVQNHGQVDEDEQGRDHYSMADLGFRTAECAPGSRWDGHSYLTSMLISRAAARL